MNPLMENLMKSANLDEQMAEKVISVVAEFLDEKLPAPTNQMASKVVRGLDAEDLVSGAMDKLGDLF